MQNVSNVYKNIVNSQDYYVESAVIICPNTVSVNEDVQSDGMILNSSYAHNEEEIWAMETNRNVFSNNTPEVGCCTCGEIDLTIKYPSTTVPSMARITPYIRVISNGQLGVSEWVRKGVFFVDSREVTKNDDDLKMLTLHGYDSMMKANANYPPSQIADPTDIQCVNEIATAIGVEVDQRTTAIINKGYQVLAPIGYLMIENLQHIASAYAGNFIINDLGKLQLIPLFDLPVETNYLSDELYNPITFGGDHIDLGEED